MVGRLDPNPIHRTLGNRDFPWIVSALFLFSMTLVSIWLTPQRINHDCAYLLQLSEMLLDGSVPYCDFVETNPPWIIYLTTLPVLVARTTGIPTILVFQGMVVAILAVASIEIYLLTKKPRLGIRATERGLLLLTWLSLYFLADYRGDVGQREQLFMFLYVPYLFLRILRHRGGSVAPWFAVLLGLQAGIGTSIKPHFLLCAAIVECALLWRTRRWRTLFQPENVSLAVVVAAYVLHWLFVPAAMRDAFFGRWLPLLADHYKTFDKSHTHVFLNPYYAIVALLVFLTAVCVCWKKRHTHLRLHFVAMVVFAGMALLVIYFPQHHWVYQCMPFEMASLLCLPFMIVVVRGRSPLSPRHMALIFLLLGVMGSMWLMDRQYVRGATISSTLMEEIIEKHSVPGDRIMVLDTDIRPTYPLLLQTNRKPGCRYMWSFPIVFFYGGEKVMDTDHPTYRRRQEASTEERQYLDDVENDLVRYQPRLVFIRNDGNSNFMPKGFNIAEYLSYSGWLETALKPYRELPGVEGWRVFLRKTP